MLTTPPIDTNLENLPSNVPPPSDGQENLPPAPIEAPTKRARRKTCKPKKNDAIQAEPSTSQATRDSNPQFVVSDYKNICAYLETESHFAQLFGHGAKTTIGTQNITKGSAFNIFANHMNNQNKKLHLTGRQLQQRFATYKKKYVKAKSFEENTSAEIEKADGTTNLKVCLENMCPCYYRIDAIFRQNGNVTVMREVDSTNLKQTFEAREDDQPIEDFPIEEWEATQDLNESIGLVPSLKDDEPNNEDENFASENLPPSPKAKKRKLAISSTHSAARRHASIGGLSQTPEKTRSHVTEAAEFRRSQNGSRNKSSLASVFEASSTKKIDFLDRQMAWEREKYEKQMETEALIREEVANVRKEKKALVEKFLSEGKTPQDINSLMRLIYD